MSKIVTINTEITKGLRQYDVNLDEAKLYLLGIYFGLDTQYISEKTRKQVNALNIVKREYRDNSNVAHRIVWNVPLFNEEREEEFSWITGFMDSFGKINPDRRGTKSAVMSRMKKFFAEHPEVRKDDVKKATEDYLSTVSDPKYLKSSHKFIYEGTGFARVSMLEQYIDKLKKVTTEDGRASKMM